MHMGYRVVLGARDAACDNRSSAKHRRPECNEHGRVRPSNVHLGRGESHRRPNGLTWYCEPGSAFGRYSRSLVRVEMSLVAVGNGG